MSEAAGFLQTSDSAASCLILQLFLFSCVLSCFTRLLSFSLPLHATLALLAFQSSLPFGLVHSLPFVCTLWDYPDSSFAVGLTPASDLCLALHPETLLFFPPFPQPQASSAVSASGSCVTLGSVPNMTPRSDAVWRGASELHNARR